MNLRLGIVANYVSQFYVTLINIGLVPVYLRQMGPEAYGLVGFFSILFALFHLLDMGLTPSVARETSKFHAGLLSAYQFRSLFRAMTLAFACVAVAGAGGIALSSEWVVGVWLKLETIPQSVAQFSVQLMAISVAMRWMGGLYRGVLSGGEHMVWLPLFNALVATLRYVGVLIAMSLFGYSVEIFFKYQLLVAIFELTYLGVKIRTLLPNVHVTGWSFSPLKPLIQFGLITALSSALGVLLMQMDKILLSGLLSLTDYGHFSLAVLVATSVMVISTPISTALQPRIARLFSEGREQEMLSVYRLATKLTSNLAGGASLSLAFCAHPLLITWTGDAAWAHTFWPVLSLYSIGYGLWALGVLPYYLQYAHGQLNWYLYGNVLLILIQVPMVMFGVSHAGAIGAAVAWLFLAMFYLFALGAVVHKRLYPGLHLKWMTHDIAFMNWPVLLGIFLVWCLRLNPQSRQESFVYVVFVSGFLLFCNLAWLAWSLRKSLPQWRGR